MKNGDGFRQRDRETKRALPAEKRERSVWKRLQTTAETLPTNTMNNKIIIWRELVSFRWLLPRNSRLEAE